MPLPIDRRRRRTTSTASPASNSPSTPTIPTGSRLEPLSRRTLGGARRRPAIRPRAGFAYLSQSLKLEAVPSLRGEAGADLLAPARPRPAFPALVPLQITAGMPASLGHLAPRRPCCASRPSRRPRCDRRSRARRARRSRSTSAISVGRRGRRRGSAREQAVGVGQQDQQAGVEQHRHLGGEEVVVAEGDLVGRGGVVLVDHRHHAPLEQAPQRLARVQVVAARGDVGGGQQHLRGPGPLAASRLS